MRGNVRCPAQASTPRPSGAPVDDVVGVRPGMSWNEAANFVMCDNPLMVVTENTGRGYGINTYGQHIRQGFDGKFAEPRVVKSSQDYLREMSEAAARRSGNAYVAPLQPGQSRYFVSTMGMPGQERVVSVAREEYFAEGKLPTVDSVRQALIAKYGQPSEINEAGQFTYIWWLYEPSGAKIAQGSQHSGGCRINASPDSGTSLSTDCGMAVGAAIRGANNTPGLAHSLAVSSQNGAEGYNLLTRTEEALRAADEARKRQELNEASRNAGAPKL
jgi:hypothetical protein